MKRSALLSVIVTWSALALAAQSTYQGLTFTTPPGWTSATHDGRFQVGPPNTSPAEAVAVVFWPAEKLNGQALEAWYRRKLADDLTPLLKVLQQSPPDSGKAGALATLSSGRTVEHANGQTMLQIYYAISDGQQAGLIMAVGGSQDAIRRHMTGIQTVIRSLNLAAAAPSAARPSADGKTVSATDVVGSWGHSSASYTDYVNSSGSRTGSDAIEISDGYTFAADGTHTYLLTGMQNSRYIRETDTGRWALQNGLLMVRPNSTRTPKDHHILSFQVAPDGAAFMTLLDTYYPRDRENIQMSAEKPAKQQANLTALRCQYLPRQNEPDTL